MADTFIVQIMRERDELMSRALSAEARLAEVESDRDEWRRYARELKARLAEAEAKLEAVVLGACRDLTAAEARLAEVQALCEEGINHSGPVSPSAETRFWLRDVSAAARGEDDRD